MAELPSGTVTFLFTDIERSTESAQALGDDRWAEALQTHRVLLRTAFEKQGGVEVGTEGDSFFVAFARAGDAAAAARDAQIALESHAWPGESRLRVRMGMHTGEALVRDRGYIGHNVHKAKRISDAGHGGQILLSQATADLIRASSVVDLGSHRLKDLGDPQPIYQLVDPDLPASFPPLRSLDKFRHTLPAQRSSFIGREREIAELEELLRTNRLVTIHGVGGCGKTRLAVHVGAELLIDFPDGVFFADLAPISDNEALLPTVANGVGAPVSAATPGAIPTTRPDDVLIRYLSERRCLVILDNCEHVLDACAELADRLLAHCRNVSILATSREALQVDGEQAWRLPSLSVPTSDQEIAASEAVSLFAVRARAAKSGFEITPADARYVAEICRRLDGIPLAIEFAAARVTHLSPKQIAEKLDDRFRLLTGGRRQVQRQLTLQAALDWSYDLLDESERVVLRRLAVFPADFSLEAAEGICSDDTVRPSTVVDILGSLVDKSLVGAEPSRDVVRFRLLETVRAYAADRLSLADEAQLVRDRHSTWHLEWLESFAWDEMVGYSALPAIIKEATNIRAAIEWARAMGRLEEVGRMAGRLLSSSTVAGLGEEARAWCREVVASDLRFEPDVEAACVITANWTGEWDADRYTSLQHVLDMGDSVSPALRALALSQRGILDGIIGAFTRDDDRKERSRRDQREALSISRHLRPEFRLVIEISNAMNELDLTNLDGAIIALEQAMRTEASIPAAARPAGTLALAYYLGSALYAAGEYERAGELMVQAGEAAQSTGIEPANVTIFFGGGAPALAVVDRPAAIDLLVTNLGEVRRLNFPRGLEDWVSGAAGVLTVAGDNERAARLLSWVRSRTIDRGIPPTSPAQYVVNMRNTKRVREALGHELGLRCREEGQALSEDEAVTMALEGLDAL